MESFSYPIEKKALLGLAFLSAVLPSVPARAEAYHKICFAVYNVTATYNHDLPEGVRISPDNKVSNQTLEEEMFGTLYMALSYKDSDIEADERGLRILRGDIEYFDRHGDHGMARAYVFRTINSKDTPYKLQTGGALSTNWENTWGVARGDYFVGLDINFDPALLGHGQVFGTGMLFNHNVTYNEKTQPDGKSFDDNTTVAAMHLDCTAFDKTIRAIEKDVRWTGSPKNFDEIRKNAPSVEDVLNPRPVPSDGGSHAEAYYQRRSGSFGP